MLISVDSQCKSWLWSWRYSNGFSIADVITLQSPPITAFAYAISIDNAKNCTNWGTEFVHFTSNLRFFIRNIKKKYYPIMTNSVSICTENCRSIIRNVFSLCTTEKSEINFHLNRKMRSNCRWLHNGASNCLKWKRTWEWREINRSELWWWTSIFVRDLSNKVGKS